MKIKLKKLHPDANIPKYATEGAACFDLHALVESEEPLYFPEESNVLYIRTGISVEVPAGHAMVIFSRSGHGFNHDVRLANCVGIIDSDYRGEVMVKLTYDGPNKPNLSVKNGDRIAQAIIAMVPTVAFIEVQDLSATERGEGGFGSTG